MTNLEREYLAAAYASAWHAVKKGNEISVQVLDRGFYVILEQGVPPMKCKAEKLLKGLVVLTNRLDKGV